MISACAESQGWEEAVTIFDEMMANEVAPDIKSTLASKKGTGSSTFCAPGPMVTLSQSLMGFHRKIIYEEAVSIVMFHWRVVGEHNHYPQVG